jgi:hypothetical protein
MERLNVGPGGDAEGAQRRDEPHRAAATTCGARGASFEN